MAQPADAQLTPRLAREICQRTGSAAVLEGSIHSLGRAYVLGLRAAVPSAAHSFNKSNSAADSLALLCIKTYLGGGMMWVAVAVLIASAKPRCSASEYSLHLDRFINARPRATSL